MPPKLADSLKRRGLQLFGLALMVGAAALVIALLSFDPKDPSINRSAAGGTRNWLGAPGAHVADVLLQTLGIAATLIALIPAIWGWRLMTSRSVAPFWLRLTCLPVAVLSCAIALAALPKVSGSALKAGAGGASGELLSGGITNLLAAIGVNAEGVWISLGALTIALVAFFVASAVTWREWLSSARRVAGLVGMAVGSGSRAVGDAVRMRLERRELDRKVSGKRKRPSKLKRLDEPVVEPAPPEPPPVAPVVAPAEPKPKKRRTKARQQPLNLSERGRFRLPGQDLLQEPPAARKASTQDDAALVHSAQMLETVLEDFGVKGEIVNVRPGPVVTLYEFEPAPGIKSSRIVNLSDDIARSMSAVSVRVAVIPGRTVIGIELPNASRETVYLRELLEADGFGGNSAALGLILGKDIGGAPIIADLSRMPHLLIAGTTGSGKSVAINTMILSLLYRLTPEQCKFIMIDPKMLELSVYDDIPQLLAPVVTDPRKAIVALKWAVREMEDRYQAMSKLGVRNIQGYNTRISDAKRKGERLRRRVQTGFDEASGNPIYEEQDLDLEPLPYIVVVVDEMADLMLVAGKDIEMAVQRLAQMARAAGIHLIMATQRPSVDVITGTIKANFPTRISFQVTSKIDSRTILGEQGAEQLLGQGDMLYMAGGGRITRVHGPFVSDREVEDVVRFLKSQGEPSYVEEVTESDDGGTFAGFDIGGNGNGDDGLYRQAVELVMRERKASTSFIQRHLQIGYNRAARLIERMEAEGIVSPANHAGKREILAQSA